MKLLFAEDEVSMAAVSYTHLLLRWSEVSLSGERGSLTMWSDFLE